MYDKSEHDEYSKIVHDLVQNHFDVSNEDMKKYYEKYSWSDDGIEAPFEKENVYR